MNANRKKKKYVCPNPLFEKWLTEWKNEAVERGLQSQYTYKKALSSLKKYPLPLSTGKEAKILEFFGDKICAMLDEKLHEYKQGTSSSSVSSSQSSVDSGSYSITSKSSQDSVKVQKKRTNPTSKTCVVTKVVKNECRLLSVKPQVTDTEDSSNELEIEDERSFELSPGNFTVLLCVDNCETLSGHGKSKKLFISELEKSDINYSVRKLHIGDFLWVARENNGDHRELVLDYIVERKRMDDLANSIKDGRFREQKFRMKNCGLKCPVYLVENCGKGAYYGLPETTLEQAIINTQVIDGFLIKRTQNTRDSVNYLITMTRMLKNKLMDYTLKSVSRRMYEKRSHLCTSFMPFEIFNRSSIKNKHLTVKEMFGKHLLQFFGLSVEKAIAIVDQFETPAKFLEFYDTCKSEEEKISLVASIKFGVHKKNIGPAMGRAIYQYYCGQNIK